MTTSLTPAEERVLRALAAMPRRFNSAAEVAAAAGHDSHIVHSALSQLARMKLATVTRGSRTTWACTGLGESWITTHPVTA